jgi:hypothetical protein
VPVMRRVLRDVGSKISGVLAGPREEGSERAPDHEEGNAVTITETSVSPELTTGDPACVAAVDVARAAALEVAGPVVGDHLGVEVDDALVVTHSFATTEKAYRGWRWAVTVARAEGSDEVTVDEVVLLPGAGALVSPAWVPYADRVQPGDLSPGDLLPPSPDDPRLVPSYADPDADLADEVHWELGLGRIRVLSLDGRADAAERWYDGDRGPAAPIAKAAPALCGDCGFLVPLAGSLRQLFGVCANGLAPDDGRVVSADHGCGAHSEVVAEPATTAGMAVEHDELELVALVDAAPAGHGAATVGDDDPAEPFGHS